MKKMFNKLIAIVLSLMITFGTVSGVAVSSFAIEKANTEINIQVARTDAIGKLEEIKETAKSSYAKKVVDDAIDKVKEMTNVTDIADEVDRVRELVEEIDNSLKAVIEITINDLEEFKKGIAADVAKQIIDDAISKILSVKDSDEIKSIVDEAKAEASQYESALTDAKKAALEELNKQKETAISDESNQILDDAIKAVENATSAETVKEITEVAMQNAKLADVDIEKSISVNILNYEDFIVVGYKSTVTFHYEGKGIPKSASVHWYINGEDCGTEESIKMEKVKDDFTIQVKVLSAAGNVLSESEKETVIASTTFMARLVSFFRWILGLLPVLIDNIRIK